MCLKIVLMLLLASLKVFGADVEVFVNPKSPIIGEPFHLIFSISMDGDETPYISFDQSDLIVQGRENRGHSRKVTIINGKISSRSEVVFAYEILAERAGTKKISNIKVDAGGKTYTSPDYIFKVYDTPPAPKKIFILADVSKKNAYVGEGIDVNYYLYYKVPVLQPQVEIQEYPDFKDFLKRFYMINQIHVETVQYEGEIYKRELRYAAKVFPTKTGELKLGTLKLKVPYAESSGYNRFGFGFGFNNVRTQTVQNAPVHLNVMPLPANDVPKSFTGLVGEHDFKLITKRDKYLVNEVVEFQLEVSGEGALETYDAPLIYSSEALENFDVKSEIIKTDDNRSKKVFNYTLLARAPVNIQKSELELSYFDPVSKTFQKRLIEIPSLIIGGVATAAAGSTRQNSVTDEVSRSETKVDDHVELIAPIFYPSKVNLEANWPIYLNMILIIVIAILGLSFVNFNRANVYLRELRKLENQISKNGPQYSNVFNLLKDIRHDNSMELHEAIKCSGLSDASKQYFLSMLKLAENSEFTREQGNDRFKYNKKSFKELMAYLEKSRTNATNRETREYSV